MDKTTIRALLTSAPADGTQVTVSGWARTVRSSKNIGFIELNDGSCFAGLQIVLEENSLPNCAEILRQNVGAALTVTGKVALTPERAQPLELRATAVVVEGESSPEYPLQKKRHSLEYLRTIAHLRPRTNTFNAAFRVRDRAAFAIHTFFHERGFIWAHTPLITTADGEGAGEMFRVTTLPETNPPLTESGEVDYSQDFFSAKTGLTVTGQLEAESLALAFGGVYTFGPTFRAERSNTPRHAAEFWMVEPEVAFADLDDIIALAADMLRYILRDVLTHCPDELAFFDKQVEPGLIERLEHVASSDFARVTYTEAVAILEKVKDRFVYPVFWGCDLQTEHERYLTEEVYGRRPVFVTDYPREIKAFYMRLSDDGKTVAAADLLVPGVGELIGGSQREERLDVLREVIKEKGLPAENYEWYLDLRRFGGAKHAGYGIGFERLLMYLTGLSNIRDVIPFPRTTGSALF